MQAIERIKGRRGLTAAIYADEDCCCPLDYAAGQGAKSTGSFQPWRYGDGNQDILIECPDCYGSGWAEDHGDCRRCDGTARVRAEDSAEWCEDRGVYAAVPAYYIGERQGGIHSSEWEDANTVVYIESDKYASEPDRERDEGYMRQELDELDRWIQGDCYYIRIEAEDGNAPDACGGFIGYDYALDEARRMLTWCEGQADEEANQVAYWNERDVVTVGGAA